MLVWGKKLKRGVDCSIQYCSFVFLFFVDDTAEVWGRVAICPKPAINLRGKKSLEHWCVSRSLVFDAWCSRPGPLASLSSCWLIATIPGPSHLLDVMGVGISSISWLVKESKGSAGTPHLTL